MNVVFFLDRVKKGVRIEDSVKRNPGLGGSQFDICMVATMLNRAYSDTIVTVCTDCDNIVSDELEIIYCKSAEALLQEVINRDAVFVFNQAEDAIFYEQVRKSRVPSIVWVHNYLTYNEYDSIVKTDNIKRVVFVGQQHYDHYIDSEIIDKSTYIFNCTPICDKTVRKNDGKFSNVVYIGSLIPPKGFHVVAKAWKKILKECPESELYVIGGGLYGDSQTINKYVKYCNKFLKDEKGNLLSSVHYLGTLNEEKEHYYEICSVGVANPTGKTETFCNAAVEFEAKGIPVVTYRGYGLLDTVENGKSGYCIRGVRQFAKAVIELLKNQDINYAMGNYGHELAMSHFTADQLIDKWHWLLNEGIQLEVMPCEFSHSNYLDDWKWLRYINFKFQNRFNLGRKVSLQVIGIWTRMKIRKLFHKGT